MARISTYPVDNRIIPDDKVLGTDATGLGTKNYTFQGIVNWLNATGAVAINGQNNYFFQSVVAETGRLQGTISFNFFGGVGVQFSNINGFMLAEQAAAGYTLEDYLPILVGKQIMLAQLDNLDNFAIYDVTSLQRDDTETEFFNIVLAFKQGNGALELDKFYGISMYAGNGDKTFVFNQSTPANPWTINHGLNKFPSVTMALSTGQVGIADVTYIDTNNLTITFAGDESGKAYMN
jgi:hypothetical protein